MKKNLNKVPDIFNVKIDGPSNFFTAATTLEVTQKDISEGKYSYLGINLDSDGKLKFRPEVYPANDRGRYSKKNADGWFVTRKDLPKVSKTYYLGERPIFGDYSKGTFSLSITKLIYHKDFFPPPDLSLIVEHIKEIISDFDTKHIFKISTNRVLDKRASDFNKMLLFDLNLLQENIGNCDVYPFDTPIEDYLKTLNIGWELLPLEKRGTLEKLISGGKLTDSQIATIKERYTFLESLSPIEWVKGVSGMKRYFGAKFAENLVVLENMDYGNAIYVMFDDWERLSKLSRTELLKSTNKDFERIKHNGSGWRTKLKMIIDDKLNNN